MDLNYSKRLRLLQRVRLMRRIPGRNMARELLPALGEKFEKLFWKNIETICFNR